MRAIILSAGRGSRLAPLTDNFPKCLVTVGDCSILEAQLLTLRECGVRDVRVVTGFGAHLVDDLLSQMNGDGFRVEGVYNPFYAVADNLVSCWMAASQMDRDFVLLNGDTLVHGDGVRRLLDCDGAPVVLATNSKASYDSDDMKVQLEGDWITAIRKDMAPETANAESIGFMSFRDAGPQLFAAAVNEAVRMPNGLRKWYLSAISLMAASGMVQSCRMDDIWWTEIDTLADLQNARASLPGQAKSA